MVPLALAQTLVPLAAMIWLMIGRPMTAPDMALRGVSATVLTFAVAQAGLWLALPRGTIWLLAALLLLALVVSYRRNAVMSADVASDGPIVLWGGRALTLAALGTGVAMSGIAIAGQAQVSPAIDLAFPFGEGRYLVTEGGSTGLINAHVTAAADEPGQIHAVDLVRIDSAGFRTRSSEMLAQPSDPAAYRIYGTPVIAPCGGLVEAAVDDLPDGTAPQSGPATGIGNHVRLRCVSNIVVLGNLRQGSIAVEPGRMVAKGRIIGAVGNSGDGGEPHLHIHAQRAVARGAESLSGAPVAIRFEGSSPVRNTQFAIE